jgi:hypothetical protein
MLAAACGMSCTSPLSDGVLTGTVILGLPVSGAEVRVWRLDLVGQRRDPKPVTETTTDEAGRFRVELGAAFGNLLVETAGGQARELWANEAINLDPSDRLVAVLPLYVPVAERAIVISPFTTVAAALAERRLTLGEESVYHEAMQRAYAMLGLHLGDIDITDTPAHPIGEPASQLTARVRHGLVLGALSLLAGRMADAAGASVRGVNTMILTHALVADASSETPRLDGIGPEGPIELGQCQPQPDCPDCRPLCRLSADTLRIDLAETLAFHLVGSMVDGTGLLFGDVAALADDIAAGVEPLLFGDVAPGAIRDDQGRSSRYSRRRSSTRIAASSTSTPYSGPCSGISKPRGSTLPACSWATARVRSTSTSRGCAPWMTIRCAGVSPSATMRPASSPRTSR